MPYWLDRWTNVRRLNQQELARRWAAPDALIIERPTALPIEHSKYISRTARRHIVNGLRMGAPAVMANLRPPPSRTGMWGQ